MPVPHIIFDFDGTLIDSSPAILETLNLVIRAQGLVPVRPLTRELIGPPLLATLQLCTGISDRKVLEELAGAFRSRYDTEGIYATQAYPDVPDVLQQLRAQGSELHLATNKREVPTLLILRHFGWAAWFKSVYCIDSRAPAYPDKGNMLLEQLKEQKLNAGDTIYVGDTAHDQKAAAQAGLRFLAAGWGYGVGEQAVAKGSRVLHTVRDMLAMAQA